MSEGEVQIDIVNLFHYILKKWRIVVIAMLVLGVVADLYYVKESSSNAAAVESQTIEEESIETQIRNAKEICSYIFGDACYCCCWNYGKHYF